MSFLNMASESTFDDPQSTKWMDSIRAIRYFKSKLIDKINDPRSINSNIVDVNRAFIIYCCSMANYHLSRGQQTSPKAVLFWARVACIDTLYLIRETDQHYGQVI